MLAADISQSGVGHRGSRVLTADSLLMGNIKLQAVAAIVLALVPSQVLPNRFSFVARRWGTWCTDVVAAEIGQQARFCNVCSSIPIGRVAECPLSGHNASDITL